jgi:hypothetical protein
MENTSHEDKEFFTWSLSYGLSYLKCLGQNLAHTCSITNMAKNHCSKFSSETVFSTCKS